MRRTGQHLMETVDPFTLFGPSQFGEERAQSDELVDVGRGREGPLLRAPAGHPTQDVGLTAPL